MTAQDLKNAILQLAVQGKLVPQDPHEGTSETIIHHLKQYHSDLKQSKDELDYSSMAFDYPDSWRIVELNQLFNFIDYRGKTPHKTTEGVFLITASNIKRGHMDYSRKEFISPEEYESRKTRGITQKGALLFTTEAPMGNVALCDMDVCSCGQRIITLQQHEEKSVIPALFMYFILSSSFQKQLMDNCTGTTAKGIKADKLKHFHIPLPPLSEQKRIVEKIEELMPLVEEYGKAEERLTALNAEFPDKLRKSILQQAIQGKLTERDPADEPASELLKRIRAEKERLVKEGKTKKEKPLPPITEEEMPFELPENWAWTRIGDILEVNPRNTVADETEVGFIPMPLLEPGFVNKHTFDKRLWKQAKKNFTHFQNGDVVFAKITPCFQNRKSAIIAGLPNGFGAGTTELHVLRPFSGLILNEYVLWFVKNERFILDGVEHFTGSVGQQRVGTDYIKQYPIPLPPIAEQQRIVERVNELLAMCDELK